MHMNSLRSELRSIKGNVTWDDEILDYYSVDSSFYQVRPRLVVFPKNASDVIKVLRIAKRHKISVTPRGGATGLVGGALNDGIILDMKNFTKIQVAKNHVSVEAGVRKGQLDLTLRKHRRFLGPNPSVGPYCTLGGMIATNASGSRSIKYGSMIDNLLEVTIVTGDGKLARLPSKTVLADSVLELARSANKKDFPCVSKNSCGYRLDAICDKKDSQKIIAASEGTLGIIISAKLRIFDTPKRRALLILGYDSIINAADDCLSIVKLKPSALELVDHITIKNIKKKFPKKTRCLLFVEFDSDIHTSICKLKEISAGKQLYLLNDAKSIDRWWAYRNSALHYSLKNLLAGQISPHVIEDAAVPIERLKDLILVAQSLRKKFGAKLVMYGHAGNGNIHVRVALPKNNKMVDKMARSFFSQVIGLGGTITGEHGDGLARTKFVRMQYGPKTCDKFKKLKRRFDPDLVLNPNKIIAK